MSGPTKVRPSRKILIANRGEIACGSCAPRARLGYGTVAVYSEAMPRLLACAEADQAVRIGAAVPAESYLNIAAIDAAKRERRPRGSSRLRLLAENDVLRRLPRCGPGVHRSVAGSHQGDGQQGRRQADHAEAGVPCVPGYQGADQSDAVMLAEANKIGFPVMIKAVAGGGGRGMRLVDGRRHLPDMLRGARSEAHGAFGDATRHSRERAIADPRHIEIQVFGDAFGDAIHLGDRDCSVQRRHQKLIEEAPSPAVSPACAAADGRGRGRRLKSLGYEGAGTWNSCSMPNGSFFFMEMNTRLQVEHPVTEAITGLDLVELQLRVAAGEPLGWRRRCDFSGHAIEVQAVLRMPREISCRSPAGWRCGRCRKTPGRARTAIRCGDSAVLRFDDRQAGQPWRDP